ncbi:MAG: hypothetical protein Q9227_004083 [Pyrenula ochraceoflavens]
MADLGFSSQYPIHLGYWTNWSHGRVEGATLTLTHVGGALLTAFLALFVAFAGTSFWRLTAFAIHQTLSSDQPKDGLYHQIQAVLRNSANGTSALTALIRIGVAWRSRASRPLIRLAPLLGFAFVTVVGFAVAGLFSSKIGSALGNEVLISSSSCGVPFYSTSDSATLEKISTIYSPYDAKRATSFSNYAQRCYSNATETEGCSPFIKRQLPSTVEANASCPFAPQFCRSQDQNIRLDTGFLNTHDDLGMNSPPSLRYVVRLVTQCAPLVTEGYTDSFNYSNDKTYSRYFYGRRNYNAAQSAAFNQTYEYEQRSRQQFISEAFTTGLPDYNLGVVLASSYGGSLYRDQSTFLPLDGLFQGDGDVALFFLSANNILYSGQVEDPWYSAHQPLGRPIHSGVTSGAVQYYLSDEPASVLGCKMQYQVCDANSPTNGNCSQFGGVVDVDFSQMPHNDKRGKVMSWALGAPKSVLSVVTSLKASSLTSRFSLQESSQIALPDNQWQLDVQNWHNIVLASLQGGVVDSATGPNDPGMLQYFWKRPGSSEEKYLCKNQKILSSEYANFSVLGLILVLALGSLIILLDYTLESIIVFIENKRGLHKYSRLEWFTNEVLETQRLAHEELGIATWEGCAGVRAVPVTKKGEMLGVLNIQDPAHPRLNAVQSTSVDEKGERPSPTVTSSDTQFSLSNASGRQAQVKTNGIEDGDSPVADKRDSVHMVSPVSDTIYSPTTTLQETTSRPEGNHARAETDPERAMSPESEIMVSPTTTIKDGNTGETGR